MNTENIIRDKLSSREEAILMLIGEGKGNNEIAQLLSIRQKTVKNHINTIYSKLQIKNRYEAIVYALSVYGNLQHRTIEHIKPAIHHFGSVTFIV